MLEIVPFVVLCILGFHFHDAVPWWAWVFSVMALFSSNVLWIKKTHGKD
jgi:hypothetical protein